MFQFDPYGVLTLVASVVSFTLARFAWTRRTGRGVIAFVVMMSAVSFWSFASAMVILATALETKFIFVVMAYLGISIVPSAILVFILDYTGRDAWVTRRTVSLLALHPILVMLVILTNPLHQGFWTDYYLDPVTGGGIFREGILFWIHAVYSYGLLLIGASLLFEAFVRAPHLYRGQITLLIMGQLAPWIGNALYLMGLSPLPDYVDLTPLMFTLTGLFFTWGMYRYQLMDITPVAHHAIFNSIVDAVFVIDLKNRIVSANPAALALLNTPAENVIGQPAALIFANQESLLNQYRDVTAAEEEIAVMINGEERFFQLRLSPLNNRSGGVSGRTVVLHDITQLKRANRELEIARIKADESARLKSEFLATMSHELRTPLSAILGYTSLMLMDVMGEASEDVKHGISRIEENSNYLLSMINNILDMSKLEAGKMDLDPHPVDPRAMAEKWHQKMAVLAANKNITLDLVLADSLPAQLLVDEERLTQVMINLLSNAVKFTHKGSVTLEISANTTHWTLQVRDTGIGIPADAQAYIFDEFRQVDGGSRRQYGGTGLGLAIVRKLVEHMSGRVWVESEPENGSSFYVELPLQIPETEQQT